jgi:hypothetical protein
MPNTILKSKNKEARGTNRMEDPNPDKVPRISARRANMKNNAYFSCMVILFYRFMGFKKFVLKNDDGYNSTKYGRISKIENRR